MEVPCYFINLIEEKDGVFGPHATNPLNDASWHGTDVGTAMPANFGLVTNAAE